MTRREEKAFDAVKWALIELAELDKPEETCGMIAFDGRQMHLLPCVNRALDSVTSFVVDPIDQKRHYATIEERGWAHWAIYHSHPHEGASPSERDLALMKHYPPGVRSVIIGLDPLELDDPSFEIFVSEP